MLVKYMKFSQKYILRFTNLGAMKGDLSVWFNKNFLQLVDRQQIRNTREFCAPYGRVSMSSFATSMFMCMNLNLTLTHFFNQ